MNLVQERITHWCERLKLTRVATEWPGLAEEALKEEKSLGQFLEQFLATECAARDGRSREILLKLATLPAIKTLEAYDFAFASGAPRKQIVELAGLTFIDRAENVVLLGPSGGRQEACRKLPCAEGHPSGHQDALHQRRGPHAATGARPNPGATHSVF